MAEIWRGAGTETCPADGIAEALIPEDGEGANVTVLYGYLWRNKDDQVRLYLTWLLDEYVDLSGIEIEYWRKVPFDGGTLVWVSRDKVLRRVVIPQKRMAQSYLAGRIADAYLAGAPWDLSAAPTEPSAAPETAYCVTKPCR
jgi:hypothetical protein